MATGIHRLSVGRDANSHAVPSPVCSTCIYTYVLTAGQSAVVTIPAGAIHVSFSAQDEFWAAWRAGSAAVPVASITDGSSPERNPSIRHVNDMTQFTLVTENDNKINVVWYS